MKINWRVRFRNKLWLLTFIAAVIGLVYQVLGLCGVFPSLSQETVISIIGMALDILVMLGVVIDPTTPDINDSERALKYTVPGGEEDVK